MGNFGRMLVSLLTLLGASAGTYLQVESWRLAGYSMYDTTIGDLERLETAADDPVSLAWSIGVIEQSFSDFTAPCGAPMAFGTGFMGLPQLCPITENQRDLLFRRLQNLQCVQLQVATNKAISAASSEADALRISDGIDLARNAFGSYDQLSCADLISVEWEEPAAVENMPMVEADTADTESVGDSSKGPIRSTIGAKAERALDVTVLPSRLFVHVPEDADRGRADRFVSQLTSALGPSVEVIGPDLVAISVAQPSLRHLKSRDASRAQSLVAEVNASLSAECQIASASDFGYLYNTNPAVRPRTFELWLPERCLPQ